MKLRKCRCCGKEFETTDKRKVYCSKQCVTKNFWKNKSRKDYEIDKFKSEFKKKLKTLRTYNGMVKIKDIESLL